MVERDDGVQSPNLHDEERLEVAPSLTDNGAVGREALHGWLGCAHHDQRAIVGVSSDDERQRLERREGALDSSESGLNRAAPPHPGRGSSLAVARRARGWSGTASSRWRPSKTPEKGPESARVARFAAPLPLRARAAPEWNAGTRAERPRAGDRADPGEPATSTAGRYDDVQVLGAPLSRRTLD